MSTNNVTNCDIKLESNLTLESNMVQFRSPGSNKSSITTVASDEGAGLMIVHGGQQATAGAGIMVMDENGKPVIKMLKSDGMTSNGLKDTRVYIDGTGGNLILGGENQDGDLVLRNHQNEVTAHISGQIGRDKNTLGYYPHPNAKMKIDAGWGTYDFGGLIGARLTLRNSTNQAKITFNAQTGKSSMPDLSLGEGTEKISSLLAKIQNLEERIAALES